MTTNNQLLKPNGMINPDAYIDKPKEKLKELLTLFPPSEYRMVLFSQFLMNKFPEGVEFKPQFVTVSDDDIWDERNASEVKLKPGHCMLKSEKVIGIGQAVGIQLEKVKDEVVSMGGEEYLLIEYIARLQLPDGTVVETPPSGKQLPLKTKFGIQAHVHESCDRKAKRNAIKELLQIPTQIPVAEAKKMWVCCKAVFKDEGGGYSQNQVKTINAQGSTAIEALYDEVKPKPEDFLAEIKAATSLPEIQAISAKLTEAKFEEFTANSIKYSLNVRYQEIKKSEDGMKL